LTLSWGVIVIGVIVDLATEPLLPEALREYREAEYGEEWTREEWLCFTVGISILLAVVASLLPAWPTEDEAATDSHAARVLEGLQNEFPDGETYHLNMFPLRRDYTRRLLAMMRARFGGHATEKLRAG
jgi:hypothetical protein